MFTTVLKIFIDFSNSLLKTTIRYQFRLRWNVTKQYHILSFNLNVNAHFR